MKSSGLPLSIDYTGSEYPLFVHPEVADEMAVKELAPVEHLPSGYSEVYPVKNFITLGQQDFPWLAADMSYSADVCRLTDSSATAFALIETYWDDTPASEQVGSENEHLLWVAERMHGDDLDIFADQLFTVIAGYHPDKHSPKVHKLDNSRGSHPIYVFNSGKDLRSYFAVIDLSRAAGFKPHNPELKDVPTHAYVRIAISNKVKRNQKKVMKTITNSSAAELSRRSQNS